MNKFLDVINGICVEYLGFPKDIFPVKEEDVNLRDRILYDILNNQDSPDLPDSDMNLVKMTHYGSKKSIRFWRNRWKYDIVFSDNFLLSFLPLLLIG